MKLHSQGPDHWDDAEVAYQALFNSEIFLYPESLSESRRFELYGQPSADNERLHDSLSPAAIITQGATDGNPSALPQLLYLSFKNHGQFLLDRLTHRLLQFQRDGATREADDSSPETFSMPSAMQILALFKEALERDDTDPDLWRRTSRISGLLGSQRLARFCLEAVLGIDGRELDYWPENIGLEKTLAIEDLNDLISQIADQSSAAQLSLLLQNRKIISEMLRKRMNTCPQLPTSAPSTTTVCQSPIQVQRIVPTAATWQHVGEAILSHQLRQFESPNAGFGTTYDIVLPGAPLSPVIQNSGMTTGHEVSRSSDSDLINYIPDIAHAGETPAEGDTTAPDITVDAPHGEVEVARLSGEDIKPIDMTRDKETLGEFSKGEANDDCHSQGSAKIEAIIEQVDSKPDSAPGAGTSIALTRKRNADVAALDEPNDNGRIRSKRIRARAELAYDEEQDALDSARQLQDQIQEYTDLEARLNECTQSLLARLPFEHAGELRPAVPLLNAYTLGDVAKPKSFHVAAEDLKASLQTWDFERSNVFLFSGHNDDSTEDLNDGDNPGLALFLEHSKPTTNPSSWPALSHQGLAKFASEINRTWTHIDEIGMLFITKLLEPGEPCHGYKKIAHHQNDPRSIYMKYKWPSGFQETVARMLVLQDEYTYTTLRTQLDSLDYQMLVEENDQPDTTYQSQAETMAEVIQTIFELHLDLYASVSTVSDKNGAQEEEYRNRLRRWAALSSQAISKRQTSNIEHDSLTLRYLWSSVLFVSLIEAPSREHVVLCLQDLKFLLEGRSSLAIEVPNSTVMPELSPAAAEREITKLTTMDFFLSIFNPNHQDPLAVVESLEPILLRPSLGDASNLNAFDPPSELQSEILDDDGHTSPAPDGPAYQQSNISELLQRIKQLTDVVDKSSVSMKIFLWRRLRVAYEAIDYPPMVFLCNIRSIQLIINTLASAIYTCETSDNRMLNLVKWLRKLNTLLAASLKLAMSDSSAFGCMDSENLCIAITSCMETTRFISTFVCWDDLQRVNQPGAPSQPTAGANLAYQTSMNQFREMYVKSWLLQYLVMKEAMSQNADIFPSAADDLAQYLHLAHTTFGMRQYCKVANKMFPKFMKAEINNLRPSQVWDSDMIQIVYDLYGLKVCTNGQLLAEHGCTPDPVDRSTASEMINFVLSQAQAVNMKDLLKTDLRATIEKLQAAIGGLKYGGEKVLLVNSGSQLLTFNRRIITMFLKSPINPIQIYRALRGVGSLSTTPASSRHLQFGRGPWYFLLGQMNFVKFRSVKRTTQTPTDDLDIAVTFFRHGLDLDTENWEMWYRLAQVYDAKIEEDTTWNADKLNSHPDDVIILQRHAIHCYSMAVAIANRITDDSIITSIKISELYTDFGNRIYSSSRDPLPMAVFGVDQTELKHCNNEQTRGQYKRQPFRTLNLVPAWVLASELFRRALKKKSDGWLNWYMLGKCLWKIHCGPEELHPVVKHRTVLDAFKKAIRYVPGKRDHRHIDKDPILEPHYKLVSIVHKLVQKKEVSLKEGWQHLNATPYTGKAPSPQDPEEWESYVLQALKQLRAADKANWHHRMVARAAHVIYDDSPEDVIAARGAKHELTQQIFTKTMAVQVWKPEYERPGRHFIYTGKYVRFFLELLVKLNDRASLEALGKRVRKKPGDFVDHPKLWSEVCMAHLHMIRQHGTIPEGHEEAVFRIILPEIFVVNANRLDSWISSPSAFAHSPATGLHLELLREVIDLKRTNSNLMKSTLIDDLIGDVYARLYELVVPDLVTQSNIEENRGRMRVDSLMNNDVPTMAGPSPALNPFSSGPEPPPPRARSKIVGRTEVRRRAEGLVAKLPAVQPALGRPKIVHTAPTPAVPDAPPINTAAAKLVEASDERHLREPTTSVVGSLHDSADDESELSEMDDDDVVEVKDETEGSEGKGKGAYEHVVGDGETTSLPAESPTKQELPEAMEAVDELEHNDEESTGDFGTTGNERDDSADGEEGNDDSSSHLRDQDLDLDLDHAEEAADRIAVDSDRPDPDATDDSEAR